MNVTLIMTTVIMKLVVLILKVLLDANVSQDIQEMEQYVQVSDLIW